MENIGTPFESVLSVRVSQRSVRGISHNDRHLPWNGWTGQNLEPAFSVVLDFSRRNSRRSIPTGQAYFRFNLFRRRAKSPLTSENNYRQLRFTLPRHRSVYFRVDNYARANSTAISNRCAGIWSTLFRWLNQQRFLKTKTIGCQQDDVRHRRYVDIFKSHYFRKRWYSLAASVTRLMGR